MLDESVGGQWEFPFPNKAYFTVEPVPCLASKTTPVCRRDEDPDELDLADSDSDTEPDDGLLPAIPDVREGPRLGAGDKDVIGDDANNILPPQGISARMGALKGGVGRRWHIFRGKPDHISSVTWLKLAQSTRQSHRRWLERIQAMPADLADRPAAVVELIMRMKVARRWRWSTTAGYLSQVATALENLAEHTTEPESNAIKLRASTIFSGAAQTAQRNARANARDDASGGCRALRLPPQERKESVSVSTLANRVVPRRASRGPPTGRPTRHKVLELDRWAHTSLVHVSKGKRRLLLGTLYGHGVPTGLPRETSRTAPSRTGGRPIPRVERSRPNHGLTRRRGDSKDSLR